MADKSRLDELLGGEKTPAGKEPSHAEFLQTFAGAEQGWKPWKKDDDEQLIVYLRTTESIEELAKKLERVEADVLNRMRHLVHARVEFNELRKKLK